VEKWPIQRPVNAYLTIRYRNNGVKVITVVSESVITMIPETLITMVPESAIKKRRNQ